MLRFGFFCFQKLFNWEKDVITIWRGEHTWLN